MSYLSYLHLHKEDTRAPRVFQCRSISSSQTFSMVSLIMRVKVKINGIKDFCFLSKPDFSLISETQKRGIEKFKDADKLDDQVKGYFEFLSDVQSRKCRDRRLSLLFRKHSSASHPAL